MVNDKMSTFRMSLTTICIASLIGGLSVAIVSGYAFFIKSQDVEVLYPKAENIVEESYSVKHQWNRIKRDWKNAQQKDLAVITLALFTGLTQFCIAMIILFGASKMSEKTIASRYILSNMVIMLVLVMSDLATVSTGNLNVLKFPVELRDALGLNSQYQFVNLLKFGINVFTLSITIDIFFIFLTMIIISCFVRTSKSSDILVFATR